MNEHEKILKEVSQTVGDLVDRLTLQIHSPIGRWCPACNSASPCAPWIEANRSLRKSDDD